MNLLTSAKTLRIPIENNQLRQTAQYLLQKQEDNIHQKLLKQEIKQSKIKKLQDDFEKWAINKEKKILEKLQKSEKNKFQIISKIVKKCQQSDKLYNTKVKTVFTKKRQSLRQAWKAAQKFNQQIQNYQKNRQFVSTRSKLRSNPQQQLGKSVIIPQEKIQKDGTQNVSNLNIKNTSKIMQASHTNHINKSMAIKPQGSTFLTHSLIFPNQNEKYVSKETRNNTKIQIDIESQQNQEQKKAYQQHYRQILLRHQKHVQSLQTKNIQELGERLNKIQKSRIKRGELSKSRFKKQRNTQNSRQYATQYQNKYNNSSKNIKKQRIKSQSYTMEKRVRDWAEHNKQKREQMLEAHIEYGNQYLYENKIKYLKTVLARNVAMQGIQKKLYIQRLKH